jgi:ATP-dependent DNA ligase
MEGEDVTVLPLLERKRRLLRIMPTIETRLLYLDHIEHRGRDLFRAACERDLEGVVAKYARGTYRTDGRATSWLKIKNPQYTQMRDRHELLAARGVYGRRGRAPMRPDLVLG